MATEISISDDSSDIDGLTKEERKMGLDIEDMVVQMHDREYRFKADERCPVTKVKTSGFVDYTVLDRWSTSMSKMFNRRKVRQGEQANDSRFWGNPIN